MNNFYVNYEIIKYFLTVFCFIMSQGARGQHGDEGLEGPPGSKVRMLFGLQTLCHSLCSVVKAILYVYFPFI